MNKYTPSKVVIENPDNLDYARFDLDFIREEALKVKRNSLRSDDYEVCISDCIKIISPNETETIYNWPSRGNVKVTTKIQNELLTIRLELKQKRKNNYV